MYILLMLVRQILLTIDTRTLLPEDRYTYFTFWWQIHVLYYLTTDTRTLHSDDRYTYSTSWRQIHVLYLLTPDTRTLLSDDRYMYSTSWRQIHVLLVMQFFFLRVLNKNCFFCFLLFCFKLICLFKKICYKVYLIMWNACSTIYNLSMWVKCE